MSYETEHIAASLKKARASKGISQRELAKRSGVPQSHISKIESNAVDLRISSLASLAHALDLELELVPRKAAPAVRSIARNAITQNNRGNADALNELNRTLRALNTLPKALQENTATQTLHKQLSEISNLRNTIHQTGALHQLRTTLEAIEGNDGLKEIRKAARDAKRLRNELVHNVAPTETQESKPAYSLDDEEDDDA
ncbi:Helix-turn-helix [Pseudovibrio denitrificans]|uniref:Helix-turn-helix n=1 Tax=Pseudovibrio denitrificans TaxID=258256 RepID=A0A1I7DYN0_9HYPH|nr:helix-turn-helix transcriptional regulator [Pseudovibrio denitrificans]SFU16771.1 Helix-turn-helix [Pseudovibrio denitrificans]